MFHTAKQDRIKELTWRGCGGDNEVRRVDLFLNSSGGGDREADTAGGPDVAAADSCWVWLRLWAKDNV